MGMAGEISSVIYQPTFLLSASPKITITLDFQYWVKGQERATYEDVKGILLRDTRTKFAWLKEKYGIEVEILR